MVKQGVILIPFLVWIWIMGHIQEFLFTCFNTVRYEALFLTFSLISQSNSWILLKKSGMFIEVVFMSESK